VTATDPSAAHRVFISFARDDRDIAERVGLVLAESGADISSQVLGPSPGEDLGARLRENIRASDVVVVMLTPAALASEWVGTEFESGLSLDLHRRGVDLIPVLAAPVALPPALADMVAIDLTKDIEAGLLRLVAQVQATARADFSSMSPYAFEELVADLLRATGFHIGEMEPRSDPGVDIRAIYERADPFGSPETEVWLVQTKLYSRSRISVQTIRELAGTLAGTSGYTRGLLVTNAQLTSMALDVLEDLKQRANLRIQVLDGMDLKRLLRRFPAVAERYFVREPGRPEQETDGDS